VPVAIHAMKITPVQTSIGSPWQNGAAERWVGSCRRELLDNVIALNERHLKRLLSTIFPTITRIEPISDSARRRPPAELQIFLAAASLRSHDSEACTTVTTALPETAVSTS